MKVLILHNRYEQPGGEDHYVAGLYELLKRNGTVVELVTETNADLAAAPLPGKLRAIGNFADSKSYWEKLRVRMEALSPDIVHLHNVFFNIGPGVVRHIYDFGAAAVISLHNHRFFCTNGVAARRGKICYKCIRGTGIRPVIKNCNQDLIKSSLYMLGSSLYRRTVHPYISRFIAPSEYLKQIHVRAGIDAAMIDVIPHFSETGGGRVVGDDSYGFIYVGRLSEEKGIGDFIEAARRMPHVQFTVAGEGPLARFVSNLRLPNLRYLGYIPAEEVRHLILGAAAMIIPSRCNESACLSGIQAAVSGVPIIATRAGALPELPGTMLFEIGQVDQLCTYIEQLSRMETTERLRLREKISGSSKTRFSSQRHYSLIVQSYIRALKGQSRTSKLDVGIQSPH